MSAEITPSTPPYFKGESPSAPPFGIGGGWEGLRSTGTTLLVFLLPWQARWIARDASLEWQTLSIFATELLAAVLLILAFFDRAFWQRLRQTLPRRLVIPALLFLAWAFFSILWSFDSALALQKAAMLSLALSVLCLFTGQENPRALTYAFVAGVLFQTPVALMQVAWGYSPPSTIAGIAEHSASSGFASVVEWTGGRLLRAYGTLPHPNVLGGFFAVGSLLALRALLGEKKKILWTAILGALLLGLALTFSRSAVLAALVASVALIFLLGRQRNGTLFLVLAFVPAIVAMALSWPLVTGRLIGDGRLEAKSIAERTSSLSGGWQLFLGSPFLGRDIGQVVQSPTRPQRLSAALAGVVSNLQSPFVEPAHFVPLEIAVELGLPGLLLFLFLIWQIFLQARTSPLGLSLMLMLTLIALFDHYLWTLWSGNLLAVFGVFLVFSFEARPRTPRPSLERGS